MSKSAGMDMAMTEINAEGPMVEYLKDGVTSDHDSHVLGQPHNFEVLPQERLVDALALLASGTTCMHWRK